MVNLLGFARSQLYWSGVRAVLEKSTWLSGLKVTLPVATHGLLSRDISAKKLIKQEVPYLSPGCSTAVRFSCAVTDHAGAEYGILIGFYLTISSEYRAGNQHLASIQRFQACE